MIRDIKHAHQVARDLMTFFSDLYADDPVDASEGGMTLDEALKARTYSRALHATIDDCVRRARRTSLGEEGFSLTGLLVALCLVAVVMSMSLPFLYRDAKMHSLATQVQREQLRVSGECPFRAYVLDVDVDVPAGWTLEIVGDQAINCLRGQMVNRGQRFLHYTATITSPVGDVMAWRR